MFTRVATAAVALVLLASPATAQHHDEIELRHLGVYPGYTGHPIRGEATLRFHDEGNVTIDYYLHDIESACAHPNASAPNSCGIHIHEGTSCANATAPGGHYYNATQYSSDPWADVVYHLYGGRAEASFGFDMHHTEGHTFVVHNHQGARVTCVVIPNVH